MQQKPENIAFVSAAWTRLRSQRPILGGTTRGFTLPKRAQWLPSGVSLVVRRRWHHLNPFRVCAAADIDERDQSPVGGGEEPPTGPGNKPDKPVGSRPYIAVIPAPRPVLTTGIIGINILTYLAELYFEVEGKLSGANSNILLALGAKINSAIAAGQLWRLFTPIFLHGGLLHLLSNTYALYAISYECEMAYGPLAFAVIYLASGAWGNLLSYWFTPYLSVGASSSIFGLFSAYIVYLVNNYAILGRQARRQITVLVALVVFNFAFGSTPGDAIDNSAHLGGAIAGALLSEIVVPELILRDANGQLLENLKAEEVEMQLRKGGKIEVKRKPAATVVSAGLWFSLLACGAAILRSSPAENFGGGML
jgi:rhomboid protease GluP